MGLKSANSQTPTIGSFLGPSTEVVSQVDIVTMNKSDAVEPVQYSFYVRKYEDSIERRLSRLKLGSRSNLHFVVQEPFPHTGGKREGSSF